MRLVLKVAEELSGNPQFSPGLRELNQDIARYATMLPGFDSDAPEDEEIVVEWSYPLRHSEPDTKSVQLRLSDAAGNCAEATTSAERIARAVDQFERGIGAGQWVLDTFLRYLSGRIDRRLDRLHQNLARMSEE